MIAQERMWLVRGDRLALAGLRPEDVGGSYLRWMDDPEVLRFTEARHTRHTPESLREFVIGCMNNTALHLLGIFEMSTGRHVGNLKIGPVHPLYKTASLGIIVGEKDCWGKGYATEAISLAETYAFVDVGLQKLTAGCIARNGGAACAFRKAGFKLEGVRRKQNFCEGEWMDEMIFGILAEEYRERTIGEPAGLVRCP